MAPFFPAHSQVPVFVQVQSKWRRFYMGQCETTGFRTSFEMVHLKHGPPQYGHLAGLLDVFKAKLVRDRELITVREGGGPTKWENGGSETFYAPPKDRVHICVPPQPLLKSGNFLRPASHMAKTSSSRVKTTQIFFLAPHYRLVPPTPPRN